MSQRRGLPRLVGMQGRIKSPVWVLPGAQHAIFALAKATHGRGVPKTTLELVHARVGQINGCAVCVDMHTRALAKLGESATRIATLAVWRETPYFTDAERAALALAEASTRLADRPDAVPDAVWAEAARHYDEPALAALVLAISIANLWNRLNVTTAQITGDFVEQFIEGL